MADPTIRTVLFLFSGAIIGGLVGWFAARYRADRTHAAAMAEKRIQITGLEEALQAKVEKIIKAETDLETSSQDLREIRRVLLETSQAKAAAQSRIERLDVLEKVVTRREEKIDALNQTIARIKTDRAKNYTSGCIQCSNM